MFKVEVIRFNHADEFQEYKFSEHCFVYGKNTRGKTALTIVIDYILGSSDKLRITFPILYFWYQARVLSHKFVRYSQN